VLEPLDLPDTVWLVLAIVVLEQPITRAEIATRRLADSDRQVHALSPQHLIREEPRAAVPGRGIPLVTTDLVLAPPGRRRARRASAAAHGSGTTRAGGLSWAVSPA
jgi:chromosome segregation and condensation protein ScpB